MSLIGPSLQGIFTQSGFDIDRMENQRALIANVSHYVQAHTFDYPGFHTLCDDIEKTRYYGPIKILFINGHGAPNQLEIGVEEHQRTDNPFTQKLDCLDQIDKNAVIILAACNVAGENLYAFKESRMALSFNIQMLFANLAPGRTVFAPPFKLVVGSTQISINNTLESMEVSGNNMWGRRIPFTVISPSHAEFCDNPLSYFAMQNYCDTVGKKPSNEDMRDCENDADCAKAIACLRDKNSHCLSLPEPQENLNDRIWEFYFSDEYSLYFYLLQTLLLCVLQKGFKTKSSFTLALTMATGTLLKHAPSLLLCDDHEINALLLLLSAMESGLQSSVQIHVIKSAEKAIDWYYAAPKPLIFNNAKNEKPQKEFKTSENTVGTCRGLK